ncbi:MAG: serine/threonine-protein kinase, partial [Steroidobacteraceae bacterium]
MTRWLADRTVAHLRELPDDLAVAGDRYELKEEVGRGGMGVVFRARDRELERDVAVKVLHARATGAADRLLQEARILGRLEHPGIVPIHDVGTLPDGRVLYVMKLVRGSRLDHHVARDGALADKLRIFDRLCDAVAFAHAHGIIHRDLKPENVMIGAFGEVLVLDWGVAKVQGMRAE